MSAIHIIPCLDVADGRIVKGVRFVDLVDAGDPVANATAYAAAGADEICLLDIRATVENRPTMIDLVTRTASAIDRPLIVGGGVRSLADVARLIDAGAAAVSIGSAALTQPALIGDAARRFGAARVILALDARATGDRRWEVLDHGGTRPTGLDPVDYARRMADAGAGRILLTSIDRDGTRNGYDLALTRAVADAVPVPVIASGGAGSIKDLIAGVTDGHAAAVLAASLFHFGIVSIPDARRDMAAAGLDMGAADDHA